MADINQSQDININNIENQVKNSVKNINVDLSKIDMSTAIDSFKRLEEVAKASNFDAFLEKIVDLKEAFTSFQNSVRTAGTNIQNFSQTANSIQGAQIAQSVEIDNSTNVDIQNLDTAVENLGGAFQALTGPIDAVGNVFVSLTGTVKAVGEMFISVGQAIAAATSGIADIINSTANLINAFANLGFGLMAAAQGTAMLIPLLPQLGTAMLQMAVNMSGISAYLVDLILFLGILLVLSLLGEGLMAAGEGLTNIGTGLTSMTEGMAALLAFMPVFIASLSGITDNVGGIILFVFLAAAMLVMAIAMQMMNEQMTQFVDNMTKLAGLMSVGFVAAFAVFAVMLIAMSFFMDKVAQGMDKITKAMEKQIAKLGVLNPLMAAYAILSNPFIGAITVALAIAGGLLVKALLPAMATGGIVSSPTVAMVGEGRYPEAVVPLGDSPQFASMKTDIANAVLQGIMALNGKTGGRGNSGDEIVLNVDGVKLARAVIPSIEQEYRRKGYNLALKGE